ncbi:MAG: sulfatase [Bacteroidota bacterium]
MRYVLPLLIFAVLACQPPKPEAKQADSPALPFRPHILWLVAEDLSPIIPPFGDSTVQTPNLSRLAAEGVRYPNLFSVSGVCAPSRAGIATGMYPISIGAHNMRTQYSKAYFEQLGLGVDAYDAVPPPAVRMMSQILREQGYYATNNDKTDYQMRPSPMAWDESGQHAHWRDRASGQNFFSIFNFGITHESQVFGPSGKKNLRYRAGFPDRSRNPGWGEKIDSSEWKLHVPADLEVPVPPYLVDNEPTRNDVRRAYSNIVQMDQQVGYILDQLEQDGLLDSTIIVWYTDHGGPLPRQKRLMYDSGLRVPMIIRFPGAYRAGEMDSTLVSFIDLAPTMFSLAGIQPPDYLQGQAFLGEYQAAQPRQFIHGAADRLDTEYDRIRAVRDNRYKYLRNFNPERGYYLEVKYREQMVAMQELLKGREAGTLTPEQAQWFRESKPEEEVFDTQADPHELRNLADDPAYAAKLAKLRAECERWLNAVGDKGEIPEPDLIRQMWGGTTAPLTTAPAVTLDNNKLSLSNRTEGASMGYQIGAQTGRWTPYTGPVEVDPAQSIRVIAHRLGYTPSEVVHLGGR